MRPLLLALLLPGCSEPLPGPVPELAGIFPHPEGFDAGEAHGPLARGERSGTTCRTCHGAREPGPSAVPCASRECHPSYPHLSGWREREGHGAAFLDGDDGWRRCATRCHGSDLGGGVSRVDCTRCHAAFPHLGAWEERARHGAWIVERGTHAACLRCHQLPGGCGDCHLDYPHPEGWDRREGHGDRKPEDCQACHGRDLRGGTSRVGCQSCHATFPHQADWPARHRAYVRVYGDLDCSRGECHTAEEAVRGKATEPRCTQRCHQPEGAER